jgi:hypothetical protein
MAMIVATPATPFAGEAITFCGQRTQFVYDGCRMGARHALTGGCLLHPLEPAHGDERTTPSTTRTAPRADRLRRKDSRS